ncbi:hypothetical protein LWI29_018477 [Acer saccharum]|uniref:Protein FAR1-RELATED SEQUENCE n=1 Tax=Acer saccharum TaxID=4024 RepID=A0AA39S5S4_ACESA|nr:hypothetical protein LWI29_018477 [Acer saccharum]
MLVDVVFIMKVLWAKKEDFPELVKNTWAAATSHNLMHRFLNKLASCAGHLQKWNQSKRKSSVAEINAKKKELVDCNQAGSSSGWGMGNGEEHPYTLTPCSLNPPSMEFNEDRLNPQETEDCNSGTCQNVEIDGDGDGDGDHMIEEPKKGMEFDSLEDLLSYYKCYGKKCGFGVMTKRIERGEDQIVRYVTLACSRGGKARNRSLSVAKRLTGKTECKAKINALRCDGKLRLTTVHNIHNHGLSPKKSRFFRCNREVSDVVKRVLDTNDRAGVRMNKSFGSLVVGAGGFENLPFLEKDCRNYIDKARHLRLGAGGAGALQEYFLRMQYKNPGFFALMDLDDDGRSPIEKRFQELYTNSKFKEVQQQVTGMIDINPQLHKSDGAVKTYLVKDEVQLAEFTKVVTYSVDFSEENSSAKCSCGLFQMRGILCRHILAVFKCNEIKYLPGSYILDRWRKDIKRRYTLIHSSYDAGEQRADSNRYSKMLNICYQMITLAVGSREHTQDAKAKLYDMIDLYRANQEPPSMTQTGSNVGCARGDATTVGGSEQVLSPNVVRGKGRPSSLRRASRMEKDMRKVKAKEKKAQEKGKRKRCRDGGDAPILNTQRSLFGHSEMDIANAGHVQSAAFHTSGTQIQGTVIQSQESVSYNL